MCSGTSTPLLPVSHAAGPRMETRREPGNASAQGLLTSGTGWKRVRPGEKRQLSEEQESGLQEEARHVMEQGLVAL